MKLFRWKAIVPMVLVALTVAVLWRLFLNTAIRRSIELVGTEVVGARVELASARFRLLRADLVLRGLQVTNPDAPMTNLVEVEEMVADLDGRGLLLKKAVVDTLAVRGVRFGTARRTSGAIERPSPTTGLVTRRVLDWTSTIPTPSLDLSSIVGTVVNVPAIAPESLQTLRQARAVSGAADSLRSAWTAEVGAINPQPVIDSARALTERLRATDARRLGVQGVAQTATQVRSLTQQIQQSQDRLAALERNVAAGVSSARAGVAALDSTRRADYAYARNLVQIPSFAAPDVSAALFGEMAKARLAPVLRWVQMAEAYVPAGLRPRPDPGPKRARMDGTTYRFPAPGMLPAVLLRHADADLAIGGGTVAAGAYTARLENFTTEPAVLGRPMTFGAGRTSDVGPSDLRVTGVMDRVGAPFDSLDARIGGVALPDVTISAARGARLAFGASVVDLGFARRGEQLDGFYRIRAPSATWTRSADSAMAGAPPRRGSTEWAEQLVWNAISGVTDVQIEMRFTGLLRGPAVSLTTNVGSAVAGAVQREIGAEIERAEREVRAAVDRQIAAATAEARQRASALESDVQRRVGDARAQLEQAKTDLEARLRELQSSAPVPNLPSLPRPRLPRP